MILGLNFDGNHTVLADERIPITTRWLREGPGIVNHRATAAGRGSGVDRWCVEKIIDRGYALATFYYGDVVPDDPSAVAGIHEYFFVSPNDWSAVAAWSWCAQRAVDHLITDKTLDPRRIIVFGHSRNGKAALLAAAFDERIAGAIPHQAGCGGTAPSRCHNPQAEHVTRINQHFPHWFNAEFKTFNGQEDRLPFDQHALVAMCFPRAVLLSNGEQDQWANPPGQFEVLQAAARVYRKFGVAGIAADAKPAAGKLIGDRLCYYTRDATHTVDPKYWDVFLDFADKVPPVDAPENAVK